MSRKQLAVAVGTALSLGALVVAPATAQESSSEGSSRVLVAFDPDAGQLSEGVTVDADGNVFASWSPLGQVVKVPAGSDQAEPFGAVAGVAEGDIGLIGLATDGGGNVYGALMSSNPEANGVWRFEAASGEATRIDGTEAITMPNSVAFGGDGTMYVTDSIAGGVWRVPAGGSAEPWLLDPLLEGNGAFEFGFPIGANGIDVLGDTVYVGVSEQGSVVQVPIAADGSPGAAEQMAQLDGVVVDGITVDAAGNVFIADPVGADVVKVDPMGRATALGVEGLDAPTSVDLGLDAEGRPTLYVASFSIAVSPELGAGPSIVAHTLEP